MRSALKNVSELLGVALETLLKNIPTYDPLKPIDKGKIETLPNAYPVFK